MQPVGWMFLNALINRYHPGSSQHLVRHLTTEDAETLAQYPVEGNDVQAMLERPEVTLTRVHYSWLAPTVKGMPASMQPLILAALPETQRAKISSLLGISAPTTTFSDLGRSYVLSILVQQYLQDEPHLPIQFLPQSPLNVLLPLNKAQLVEMIDFLGLQDLAEALRHIVDKQRLKSIYHQLNPKQQQHLKTCLHHKDRLNLPTIELSRWEGKDWRKLQDQLHRRGLARLGIALSGQHPDLVWHLSRHLDTGRGQLLFKSYQAQEIKNATPAMIITIQNLMKFLYK
jgi:hypothetical protein